MPSQCLCFVKALGCENAFEASLLSISERRHLYAQRSRICHPDKQSANLKEAATRAQTLLNLMREEIIDDEESAIKYLQTGQTKGIHSCLEMVKALEAIQQLVSSSPSSRQASPRPETMPTHKPAQGAKRAPLAPAASTIRSLERRSRETSSPPNTPRVGPSRFMEAACPNEDDDDDSDVEIIKIIAAGQRERPYASPPPSPQPVKRGASQSKGAPARQTSQRQPARDNASHSNQLASSSKASQPSLTNTGRRAPRT